MKNLFKILIVIYLIASAPSGAKGQSSLMTYNPSSSTLIGSASRIGYHLIDYFTFYMRYNDSSYFCSELDAALWIPNPTAFKATLPQNFIITDFIKFRAQYGVIGSYEGVGMYAWTGINIQSNPLYDHLYIFKMPTVDRLKRVTSIWEIQNSIPSSIKTFSIGEKSGSSDGPARTHFMEFYAGGLNEFVPYYYAPMPQDSVHTGEAEIADDVITLSHYVVLATRDYRSGHAQINLRISDTANVLLNTDIDYQHQLWIHLNEKVVSELRLTPLKPDIFVLTYVKHNPLDNVYLLCTNKIILSDLLGGNNTIVSHEIKLDPNCIDLVDVIYMPGVNKMVLLLNGNGESELYHVDPFSNTNSFTSKLVYSDGCFYSLDTIGNYYQTMPNCYTAIGGNVIFCQEISNNSNIIDESCLDRESDFFLLRDPPNIEKLKDPLKRYTAERNYIPLYFQDSSFAGNRTCIAPE